MRNMGTCRPDAKGSPKREGPARGRGTKAGHRGGVTRSSEESSVMGRERRGDVILLIPDKPTRKGKSLPDRAKPFCLG